MSLKKAILATISYHDIFDYPLTSDQLGEYLIGQKANKGQIKREANILLKEKKIAKIGDYFMLSKRTWTLSSRKKRESYSRGKLTRANFFAKLLKNIPTVSGVCLTGALAMENSNQNDDIDLLIFTKKGNLWTTRLLANLMLFPFKRNPHSKKNSNKACLNIFIDEVDLQIKEQNLYTAHEICQMKLLWGNNVYKRFLYANSWIKNYLPNWTPDIKREARSSSFSVPIPMPIENLIKQFQIIYMKSKVTTEKIGEHQLFFHPKDTQHKILKIYNSRVRRIKS